MFSQNPARSIQDRPDENAVSPIDDIWDRATPDDSFGSDTEDSDEEGEDLAARDTPFGDREGQEGDSQTTRDEGINAELFCAAQKGRSRMNKSVKAALNKFFDLEFSEAHNQPLSSSSGADDVAAPTLPSVPLPDDSASSDISIPRCSPPASQFMSLSDDAYHPPLSGQETSQGGLEREFMDINDGQGYDDLPAIMMDESLLETGFEGDGYGGVI
ncbi:hypothetical protein C356_06449, partial [Cryptococcus neoformans c45]